MKFTADFESFLRTEVNLNKTRLDTLQDRVDAVESFISSHETFENMFLEMIPAGSWAHRTIIKPVDDNDEFDADVLLSLEEQTDWLPKDYIQELYSAFRDSGTYKDIVSRKTRCLRINYAGDFHIDLVPYVERNGNHFITNRLDPKDEGSFELSDPEGFSAWIDERERVTNGTFVKVVRLVKYLRDFKSTFVCKSIILTTLLGDEVNEVEAGTSPSLYADVPSTFVTLMGKLAKSLPESMPAVLDPAGTGDNFTDRYGDDWNYENFRTRMVAYAAKAQEAYDETDRDNSITLWREIFGDSFKAGVFVEAAKMSPCSASVEWSKEQFIDREPYGFGIAIDPAYSVRISGRCTGLSSPNGTIKRGFSQFNLSTRGNRVPKNRSLVFTARLGGVSGPYQLYWKVRNGGKEAEAVGQLRGEITRDGGKDRRTETSLYRGSHYVECYLVVNGAVVAKDHQIVIVTT